MLYVLDEPSIGLHQRDNRRLIETLLTLRDLGNTLIVVEHDEETIRTADWVVDIGPAPASTAARSCTPGRYAELLTESESLTGDYLAGRRAIATPRSGAGSTRSGRSPSSGAAENNLRNVTSKFPLGVFTAVTGVSGSGKSSLVNDILYEVLATRLNGARACRASTRG